MWIKSASRKDLISVLQGPRAEDLGQAREVESIASLRDCYSELMLVWHENPLKRPQLPSMIVVESSKERDLLAWAQTYLPDFCPITALCRVTGAAAVDTFLVGMEEPWLGDLEDACVGLILCEAASYIDNRLDLRQLSPVALASTCSFALARAVSQGMADVESIQTNWARVRRLTNQPRLGLHDQSLLAPWIVVSLLSRPRNNDRIQRMVSSIPPCLFDACVELHSEGKIHPATLAALASDVSEIDNITHQMQGTREQRVLVLEQFLMLLSARGTIDRLTGAFLCGYVASLVARGTIDHVGLLAPCTRAFPSALLWYGLCAGLHSHSTLQSYLGGIGRRMLREITRRESFLDRPRCDVAVEELEVALVGGGIGSTRVGSHGYLEVEIAPCINTIVRWPPRDEVVSGTSQSRYCSHEAENLLLELEQTLARANGIYQQLGNLLHGHRRSSSAKEPDHRTGGRGRNGLF